MSQEGQVRVTLADGTTVVLHDRAAGIVEHVAQLASEASEADWGSLSYFFTEGDTKVEFVRRSVLKRRRGDAPAHARLSLRK